MKSLIILGVPRAGKSTLATNIAKKLSETGNALSLINADAIMGGLTAERGGYNLYKLLLRPLRHIFPKMRAQSKRQLRQNFVNFIGRFLAETAQTSVVVFEGAYIAPEQAVTMFDRNKFKIVVVGYPNISIEDKCANIRKYDQKTSTNSLNDQDLRKRIHYLIELSKDYQKQCQKHKIHFIDTSYDWKGEIENFTNNICEFLAD